jgi:hypothetical protein
MTGIPEFNFPEFIRQAEWLRFHGWDVVSPAESGLDLGLEWADYLRHDLGLLCGCDTIVLMDGWHKSKGARLEHHIAVELGMQVLTIREAHEQ